jgi:hypothetical protein
MIHVYQRRDGYLCSNFLLDFETNSYAKHKALHAYYEGIVPLLDSYAEAYMGKYGRFRRVITDRRTISKNPISKVY